MKKNSLMEDLISVIVPVYNVEAYLDRCMHSVLNQTYQNLEILLIDDGSTDGSPALCDAYATRDRRIKVLHKPNGGLSDARNAGLALAQGAYIGYVDSDDWIEPDMYASLHRACVDNHAQLAVCRYFQEYQDRTEAGGNGVVVPLSRDCLESILAGMRSILFTTLFGVNYTSASLSRECGFLRGETRRISCIRRAPSAVWNGQCILTGVCITMCWTARAVL